MHLVQIPEHLKGIRELMGMVNEKEEVNENKDTAGRQYCVVCSRASTEGSK